MPAPHAALGIELDDGTLAARAIVLPDGSVAALSNLDSGCCCDEPVGDCDGCGAMCDSPDCTLVQPASVLPCIDIELGSFTYVQRCDYFADEYVTYEVIALGGRHRLSRGGGDGFHNFSNDEAPALIVMRHNSGFPSYVETVTVANFVRIRAMVLICSNRITGVRCPMLVDVSLDLGAQGAGYVGHVGFGANGGQRAYFGDPIRYDGRPLGCETANTNNWINGTTATAFEPAGCDPLVIKHVARHCGNKPDIVVDLGTRPDGDYRNVRIGADLYALTNERSEDDVTPGYAWTTDRCYPRIILCGFPSVAFGYDPATRPAGTLTAVDGAGFRFTPVEGALSPGPPAAGLTWTTDPCPGTAVIADDPDAPGDPNMVTTGINPMHKVYADQVARQTGCVGCGG